MKLNYFNYYFNDTNTQKYAFDIFPFIKSFTDYRTNQKVSSLYDGFKSANDENMYLIHLTGRVFLFLVTKDSEIIKTISMSNFTSDDIQSKLPADEKVSFGSYVYIGRNFFGIASTLHGPKNSYLRVMINKMLKNLTPTLFFNDVVIPNPKTIGDLPSFNKIGMTTFEINKTNTIFDDIAGIFGNINDVYKIKITLKPNVKGNLNNAIVNVSDKMFADQTGLEKFIFKGKESIADSLNDYALLGTNHLYSIVEKDRNDLAIAHSLQELINNNPLISSHGENYEEQEEYTSNFNVNDFCNDNYWDNYILSLQ